MSILDSIFKQKKDERRAQIHRALIHHEAKIGSELFGPIPEGSRREFFCLDEHTWVWHEEWTDANGNRQFMMTRYDVRPGGIVKSQGHNNYQSLSRQELINFYRAVQMYGQRVDAEYARMLQAA